MSNSAQGKTGTTDKSPAPSSGDGQRDAVAGGSESSTTLAEAEAKKKEMLRGFVSRVFVPALVNRYLADLRKKKPETQTAVTENTKESFTIKEIASLFGISEGALRERIGKGLSPVRQDFFSIKQLADRWSCSRGTVYNVLRSTGTN